MHVVIMHLQHLVGGRKLLGDGVEDITNFPHVICFEYKIKLRSTQNADSEMSFQIPQVEKSVVQLVKGTVQSTVLLARFERKGREAGRVGFEPTICGSAGRRLGPGSTTGPKMSRLIRTLIMQSLNSSNRTNSFISS